MKRLLAGLVSAAAITLLAVACDDTSRGERGHYAAPNPHCGQFDTCGTCTPALGCGWCTTGGAAGASGLCVDDPGDCPNSTTAWTWDPIGCHPARDASVLADARVATDATAQDAGSDTAPQSRDAAPDVF